MTGNVHNYKHKLHQNIINLKIIICGVEVCHLLINVFIFCYLIICTLNASDHISTIRLRLASHATNDTTSNIVQGHIKRAENVFIINDVFELVLVFNIIIAITRFTFFQ